MIIIQLDSKDITLRLTRHELSLLNNSLNEALEALDDDDLQIRVGATSTELEQLLQEVHNALSTMQTAK